MPAGAPRMSSISNDCIERTTPISVLTIIAGASSGSAIERSVRASEAPQARAASSKLRSIARSAGTNRNTLTASVAPSMCTKTIPHHEKIWNAGGCASGSTVSARLTRLLWPPRSRIHERIAGRGGMNRAIQKPTSNRRRQGRSLQAMSQASRTPRQRARACRANARLTVFSKAINSTGSLAIRAQFAPPK